MNNLFLSSLIGGFWGPMENISIHFDGMHLLIYVELISILLIDGDQVLETFMFHYFIEGNMVFIPLLGLLILNFFTKALWFFKTIFRTNFQSPLLLILIQFHFTIQ